MRMRLSQLRRIIKEEVQRTLRESPGMKSARSHYLTPVDFNSPLGDKDFLARNKISPEKAAEIQSARDARLASDSIMEDQNGYLGLSNEEAAEKWWAWRDGGQMLKKQTPRPNKEQIIAAIIADLEEQNRQPDSIDNFGDAGGLHYRSGHGPSVW